MAYSGGRLRRSPRFLFKDAWPRLMTSDKQLSTIIVIRSRENSAFRQPIGWKRSATSCLPIRPEMTSSHPHSVEASYAHSAQRRRFRPDEKNSYLIEVSRGGLVDDWSRSTPSLRKSSHARVWKCSRAERFGLQADNRIAPRPAECRRYASPRHRQPEQHVRHACCCDGSQRRRPVSRPDGRGRSKTISQSAN